VHNSRRADDKVAEKEEKERKIINNNQDFSAARIIVTFLSQYAAGSIFALL